MKSILVTGLCTLHWGRLQYGNIGNYYIVEPLFRELHKYFPDYKIITTFQMDDVFQDKEKVEVLPMDIYYSWNPERDVKLANEEVKEAENYISGNAYHLTPYMQAVLESEYIINVSGDMWGDNAEHVGHNRFLVDCLKMKVAQIFKKKTILFAVTPGPFTNDTELGKEVFGRFDLVVIREKVSAQNLKKWGFSIKNVIYAPCPSFLFEPNKNDEMKWVKKIDESHKKARDVIGMTFGGFNMPYGPYDMWPRDPSQYNVFVELAEHIINDLRCDMLIFSHTNGFDLPPNFKLKSGRDFVILEQFYQLLIEKNPSYKQHIILVDEPLLPADIKSVIGNLDLLITGRVHASVASTSQCIPTVYMEYDRNVIYSDKMMGFSEQLGMQRFVTEPGNIDALRQKVDCCYENRVSVKKELETIVPQIKNNADSVFAKIRSL